MPKPKKKIHFLKFENKSQPLLSRSEFALRLLRNFLVSSLLIALSLFAGMLGYRHLENLDWMDSFLNASMILSGMGPLHNPATWGGKLFAGSYALYSGLALIVSISILLSPVLHRFLHQFHMDADEKT
jgi:hypothetical protein